MQPLVFSAHTELFLSSVFPWLSNQKVQFAKEGRLNWTDIPYRNVKKGEPGVEVVVAGSHELIFGWIIVFRPLQTLLRFYTFSI